MNSFSHKETTDGQENTISFFFLAFLAGKAV